MKKIISILSVIALCMIGGVYLSYRGQRNRTSFEVRCRLAFFVPAVHPSMDDIERGVREHMKDQKEYPMIIDTYNANGNRTLLRAQAEEIVQGNYDAIITVGAQCSQVTHELLTKKQSQVPLIFSAVDDPVKLGLVHTPRQKDDATGVLSTSDYARQLKSLLEL